MTNFHIYSTDNIVSFSLVDLVPIYIGSDNIRYNNFNFFYLQMARKYLQISMAGFSYIPISLLHFKHSI